MARRLLTPIELMRDERERVITEFVKLAKARIRDDNCSSAYDAQRLLDEIAKELLGNTEDAKEELEKC